jgi:hypothetical protein
MKTSVRTCCLFDEFVVFIWKFVGCLIVNKCSNRPGLYSHEEGVTHRFHIASHLTSNMVSPSPPDFNQLAKNFEDASAHPKLLANSPDVRQGSHFVKALNDINSCLLTIQKSIKEVQ